jgi:hypothetical protein
MLYFDFINNYRTFKKDCPFYLNFKASEDGQFLVLHAMNNTHNHEVSEVNFCFVFK